MTEDKLLYLGIDVLVLLLVQLQLMATLSRSIFMIMDLNSVALSGVKAGSPRATEQQSCTQGKKNLEAAPRIIFAIFHSLWPFSSVFCRFCRFLPLSLFFRRFSSFFTVFNRFSQFFILFHRLFTVFFHHFFMDFSQDILRGSCHSILAKRRNPQILDSACSQDRMGAAPFYPCIF